VRLFQNYFLLYETSKAINLVMVSSSTNKKTYNSQFITVTFQNYK